MRYMLSQDVVFTNKDNQSFILKDMREFPTDYALMININVNENDMIDEIATRKDIYGENAEALAYRIYDYNIAKLFENDYNIGKVKTIGVPV